MKNFLEKVQKNRPAGRKKKNKTERVRTRQRNERGDSKVESNDSPEIPDREQKTEMKLNSCDKSNKSPPLKIAIDNL